MPHPRTATGRTSHRLPRLSASSRRKARARRLWLEALEDRRMLAVSLSSLNDFEDGTTQAWSEGGSRTSSPNPPTNISTGGPGGAGDSYVQNVSTGGNGAGGRWIMYNTSSTWTGDYVTAGVTRITAQARNTGPEAVPMGIAIGTANVRFGGNWWATTSPVSIPNDGAWHSVEFGLDTAGLTQVQGNASLNTVLSGANVLRLVANATPSHIGSTSLSGTTIGMDNIRAAGPAVPEVTLAVDNATISEASTFLLNGNAGLGLLAGNENPAVTGGSGGIGPGGISLDAATNTLSIDVRWGSGNGFTDLTGAAVAMHIHGPTADPTPAGFGQNAGVLVGLDSLTGFNDSPTNGGFTGTVVLTDAQEAAILSNQTYVNVHTAANPPGEIRGNLVAGSLATLTATLSAASGLPVTVDLGYTGTATNGSDYTPSSSQITIAAGDTSGTATVLAVDDTLDEDNETVIADITNVVNAIETGTQQATTTIQDNDDPPAVTLAVDNATISEASTFLLNGNAGLGLLAGNENPAVTGGSGGIGPGGISLDAATNTLSIDVRWGSGNGFTDLTGAAVAMHIHGPTADPTPAGFGQNAGVLVGLDSLTGFNDSPTNGGFTGTVVLTDAQEAAILSNQTYVNVHTAANPPGEIRGNLVAGSLATLTATLSAASGLPVTVDLGYTGTATNGSDYTPSSSQITIAAGDTSGTATVQAVDDTLDEDNETVIADITNVVNAIETGTQQATTTILDNDDPPAVTGSGVNGIGNNNRSQIASVVLQFSRPVSVNSVSSLRIFNHTTGSPVDISAATLENNGTSEVRWNLAAVSLPEGFYTAELPRSEVNSLQGKALQATHSILFHRLPGDSNGSAQVNTSDFDDLKATFNTINGPVLGPGDFDANGEVNWRDFGILATNFTRVLTPVELDFGDAPESGTSFPTRLPSGGRHVLGSDLRLGAQVDGEADGQPDATATGDGADEDGMTFGTLQAGNANASVTVNANVPSGTAMLNAWVDFNADGDWVDAGEQVFVDQTLSNGTNSLSMSIPAGATAGSTFARFRVTGTPGYSFFGLAPDGEVEDYQVTVVAALGGTGSRQLVFAGWFAEQGNSGPLSDGPGKTGQITSVEVQSTPADTRVIDRAIEQVAGSRDRAAKNGEHSDPFEEHQIDQVFAEGDLLKDSVL